MEKQKYMKEDIDSLISQIEGLTGPRPLFYLKFCKERKYAEDVVKGLLYANTVEHFRKLEERTGVRGQGDRNELILSFKANNISAFDRETGSHAFSLAEATVKIQYNDDTRIPLVCFVGIPLRDMKFVDADETHAEFDFPFSEKEYKEMENTFGPYCVIIGARELEAKIHRACDNANVDYVFDPVKYVVPNSLEKMQAFQKGGKDRFLYKDQDLSYQREFRFALASEIPEDHYIRIENLNNAQILESSALKNLRFSVGYTSYRKEEE